MKKEALKAYYMEKALWLAKRGAGTVSPNPMVGAVIVKKNRIIASGYHKKYGGPHAEIMALQRAGKRAREATLVVTLEPCCHFGKTPPCTETIISSGISHVVCAMLDPNPLVNGKGCKILKKAGISVEIGLLEKEVKKLNEAYCTFITKKRPFVALKIAMSLDKKITDPRTRWITSKISRTKVHQLRAQYDAVLVGKNTILTDNPRLTVRHVKGRDPWRITLDSHLEIPKTARVFKGKCTIVFTTNKAPREKKKLLEKKGITVINMGSRITPKKILQELARRNIASVLVEGGAKTFDAFLQSRCADRLYAFIALRTIGKSGKNAFNRKIYLNDIEIQKSGPDVFVTGLLCKR